MRIASELACINKTPKVAAPKVLIILLYFKSIFLNHKKLLTAIATAKNLFESATKNYGLLCITKCIKHILAIAKNRHTIVTKPHLLLSNILCGYKRIYDAIR